MTEGASRAGAATPTDNTSGVTFRAASINDLETLARLRYEMEAERHPEHTLTAEGLAAYCAQYRESLTQGIQSGSHRAWLAEANGRAVACVLLIVFVMPPDVAQGMRSRGYVSSVYTAVEYRQRGIARHLMTRLIENARATGVTRVLLRSSEMGRPLYESLGFTASPANTLEWEPESK